MWADALFLAERNHVLRLVAWGAGCVLVGTLLLLLVVRRRHGSPLLTHFAIQTAAWGAIELVIGALAWSGLAYRDLGGFTRLDRVLWLNIGLNLGYVAVGVTLALTGWALARRLALVGAGMGVLVQGLALLVLDLYLVSVIGRLAVG